MSTNNEDDPLVPVPIPALAVLLLQLERSKGAALTEVEALQARDTAVCMTMPLSKKRMMDQRRGYPDIHPENVWAEWQALRLQLE
jgi:hypothetical protein